MLRLSEGVLQRAWKELATSEERWQVVVPKSLREAVLGTCHGGAGSGHFGTSKTLCRLRRGFTGVSTGGMLKTYAAAVMTAWHTRGHSTSPTLLYNSRYPGHRWRG